jgi:hypothetical protein
MLTVNITQEHIDEWGRYVHREWALVYSRYDMLYVCIDVCIVVCVVDVWSADRQISMGISMGNETHTPFIRSLTHSLLSLSLSLALSLSLSLSITRYSAACQPHNWKFKSQMTYEQWAALPTTTEDAKKVTFMYMLCICGSKYICT